MSNHNLYCSKEILTYLNYSFRQNCVHAINIAICVMCAVPVIPEWYINRILYVSGGFTYGDKVAQLVRCRTRNQRVAGALWSVLGQDSLFHIASVYPAVKWISSINKAVLRACALYAASCSGISPGGLKCFPCVQCLLGEEGRVSASVDTRL